MTIGPLSQVLRHIRRIAHTGDDAGLEDAQLLERFLVARDEAAFEALVRRHGPMVLGVCRRLLHDPQDVEDAFQATFLVLIRKAGSLGRRQLLANWLYGVARRTALKARCNTARRQAHEKQVELMSTAGANNEASWRDLRPVLDEEVSRLPEKYRVPIILCYLEGKTFTEAALQLGWPAGTVSGRLARARELLRTRLARRGVTLSLGALGTLLAEQTASAVPTPLVDSTLKAAALVAAGQVTTAGALSAPVVSLMEGVLHAMYMSKVKSVGILLLAVCVLGAGVGLVNYPRLAAQQPAGKTAVPQQAAAPAPQNENEKGPDFPALTDDKVAALLAASTEAEPLKTLLKDRYDAAHTEAEARWKEFLAGRGTLDIALGASRRLLDAERSLSAKKEDQIAALEKYLERIKSMNEINEGRFNAGRIAIQDVAQTRFYRYDAELWLERAKAGRLPPSRD
jgi:RNA polymerase sigma factor (sigma-70 family)